MDCSQACLASIKKQIGEGSLQINEARKGSSSGKAFGLIIDGKSLEYSLKKDLEKSFFELAINCASVICCRSTPKQKALVSAHELTDSNFLVYIYGQLFIPT